VQMITGHYSSPPPNPLERDCPPIANLKRTEHERLTNNRERELSYSSSFISAVKSGIEMSWLLWSHKLNKEGVNEEVSTI